MSASPVFEGCRFIRNRTGPGDQASGGAIAMWGPSALQVRDCLFLENEAMRGGGAIGLYAGSGRGLIEGCLFRGNVAVQLGGGAIECASASAPVIRACTLFDNAGQQGSGLLLRARANPRIERTIIAYGRRGEAIFWQDQARATLSCCDLFGNAGGDWTEALADQRLLRGNCEVDPRFADPGAGDLRLGEEARREIPGECLPLGAPAN
jgi:hypothetical protein